MLLYDYDSMERIVVVLTWSNSIKWRRFRIFNAQHLRLFLPKLLFPILCNY